MLRVLLVDDEPFIAQGLTVLIDWEKEGYEIVAIAVNGVEALEYLKRHQVDLIIADIKMPVMTGIELLERIRETKISDAYFVILSGYNDFSYMQQAIRNECMDYILKPIQQEELKAVLRKIASQYENVQKQLKEKELGDKAYLARNVIALLMGKYDLMNLNYVQEHLPLTSRGVCYIDIEIDDTALSEEMTEEARRMIQRKLYQSCMEYLGDAYSSYCIFDVANSEKRDDIGFLCCKQMLEEKKVSEQVYLNELKGYMEKKVELPVVMFVGNRVEEVSKIEESYRAAAMAKSFQAFKSSESIYYYTQEEGKNASGVVLCKSTLDELIEDIEKNARSKIKAHVEKLYQEMNVMRMDSDMVNLNINYLLFQLIHLATKQASNVNQEEIMHKISASAFSEGTRRGSKVHLERFATEYAEYLSQLCKNVSGGVLLDIEREVREHYIENLTLKELSKKYYVNSAYLGQIFKKKYGMPFKDYLNNYRIEQAATLLFRTDKHVYEISEAVGYKNLDYFINRFIAVKGCTPAKYRKQLREKV